MTTDCLLSLLSAIRGLQRPAGRPARMQPARVPQTLPVVLSEQKTLRLIAAARNLKHETTLSVAYDVVRTTEAIEIRSRHRRPGNSHNTIRLNLLSCACDELLLPALGATSAACFHAPTWSVVPLTSLSARRYFLAIRLNAARSISQRRAASLMLPLVFDNARCTNRRSTSRTACIFSSRKQRRPCMYQRLYSAPTQRGLSGTKAILQNALRLRPLSLIRSRAGW